MALIVKDRVKESTTTTGTGSVTLAGASTGFRSFADIGNANTTYYCISGGSQFEVGIGTYTASGTTLSRDTVLSNSLGTTALINFSAGSKDVFVTYPSDKALLGTTGAVSSTGTGSVVLSTSPTLVTPVLGTPTSATLTNATGLPIVAGTTGTLSVAKGGTGVTTSTGTGSVVLSDNPTFTTNISSPVVNFNRFDFQTLVSTWDDVNHLGAINIGSDVPFFNDTIREINIGTNTGASGAQTYITIGDANSSTALNGIVTINAALATPNGLSVGTSLSSTGTLALAGSSTANQTIATNQTSGTLTIGGTGNSTGTISIASGTGAQTIAIANATSGAKTVNIASGASSATKTINIGTSGTGTTNIAIGATGGTSTTTVNGYFKPPALASAPTYVKGAVYFDTTLNKLRVGGATTWETITSI